VTHGWWTIALAISGTAVSGYLTAVHFQDSLLVCSGGSDCETVQDSTYSDVAGIPVAILGLAMYIAALGLAIVRSIRTKLADRVTVTLFVMLVAGFLFTLYLTYLELFVIDAICQWCVASALITTSMLIVEGLRVSKLLAPEPADS
jgi:uncharacterized membrane protein